MLFIGREHLIQRPVLHLKHDEAVLRRVEHEVGRHAVQRRVEPAREGNGELLEEAVKPNFASRGVGREGGRYHGHIRPRFRSV